MTDDEFDQAAEGIRRKYAALVPPNMPFEVEGGWLPLIDEGLGKMEDFLGAEGWLGVITVRQIKEKFGALRVYARPDHHSDWPDNVAEGIMRIRGEILARSAHICEMCGRPGEIRVIQHYHQCLCEEHAAKRQQWADAGWPDVDWRT